MLILCSCSFESEVLCFVPADAGAEDIDLDAPCETYETRYYSSSSSTSSPSAAGN